MPERSRLPMKHYLKKRAKDGSLIYNMLYICHLSLIEPGRMRASWAERVPGWAERVLRWAEQVPRWAERVLIGYEFTFGTQILRRLPLRSPCSGWRVVVVSPCARKFAHTLRNLFPILYS